MRILVFSQYYPPEIGAGAMRASSIAEGLADQGHEVDVITCLPNYPHGVIRKDYRGSAIRRRKAGRLRVWHVWIHTRAAKTTRDRLGYYGTYATMASLAGAVVRRPDVVIASSPPLPVAAAGAVAAIRHRVPFLLDVRDLWPAAAVALGELTNRRAIRLAEQLEAWLYSRAAAITTVTRPFRDEIVRSTAGAKQVHIVPNGTSRLFLEAARSEPDRVPLGLDGSRFVWTFAGNLGLAQDLQTAVAAAALLDHRFQLFLLGSGSALPELKRLADAIEGDRVVFRGMVPPHEAALYMRASDCLLVSLAKDPTLRDFIPSKLYDCCAVGRPLVVSADGESSRLAAEHGFGLPVRAGDAHALADAVATLAERPALVAQLSAAGISFATENLRERQVQRIDSILRGIVT